MRRVGAGLVIALCVPGARLGPARARRARSRCSGRGTTRGPAHAALYGFVAGVAFFGSISRGRVLRRRRDRAVRRVLAAAYWAGAGAIVGALGARGCGRRCSPRRCGSCSRRCAAGGRSAASRGASRRRAARLPGGARAREPRAACRSSRSWSSRQRAAARRSSLRRDGHAHRAPMRSLAAGRRRRDPRGRRGRRRRPLRADDRPGTLRFALLQGNDQDRSCPAERSTSRYLTQAPRARPTAAGRLRPHRVPRVVARDRPRGRPDAAGRSSPRSRQQHDAYVLVNVIDAEQTTGKAYNANRLYDPDGRLQGTYAKQHLVPVRRVRAVARRARASSASCSRSRTTSTPATRTNGVPRRAGTRSAP